MKFSIGDLVLVKKCAYKPRLRPRLHPPLRPRFAHLLLLQNTYGIITAAESHSDVFESSTENDNGYIWFSQVDQREYYFYENEVEGEVIK